jgi:hypothetical protein
MLTYYIGDYNTFKVRTAQIPVSASLLLMELQDMQTLKNTSFFVMDKSNATWNYDECESIATLTFNLEINTQGFTTGSEYRISLTPFISGSGYTAPVYHGSLQAFMSQSVNKPVYKTQNDGFISHTSENEYIIFDGGFTPQTTTTTTIAPATTTTTTIAPATTSTTSTTSTTTAGPTTTTTTAVPSCPYSVGQFAEGGVIAYILQPGDIGYDVNQQKGFVATVADISAGAEWGCEGTSITAANFLSIGRGASNTAAIVAACPTAGIAARLCDDLVEGGYSDWYLPSLEELRILCQRRNIIGGFVSGGLYWCSSQISPGINALVQNFTACTSVTTAKSQLRRVRAIRSFACPPTTSTTTTAP